jgi:glycosyltransferase involved in cell wall biosynthesis
LSAVRTARLAVIIPAHNEARYLPEVLAALRPLSARPDVETIVVDVGSTDGTADIAEAHGCRVIRSPVVFPGVARNRGAAATSAGVLAFIDGDVVVTDRWIDAVTSLLDDARPIARTITGASYGLRRDATWIERTWNRNPSPDRTSHINGGNLVMRAEEFHALRGFDETLSTGEDFDFCARARRAGMEVRADGTLATIHLGYPRSAWEFVIREGWHGTGDFSSWSRAIRSKVAMATLLFLCSVLLIPLGIVTASWPLTAVGAAVPVALCAAAAAMNRRARGVRQVLAITPLYGLYFIGRSLSLLLPSPLLAKWRASLR